MDTRSKIVELKRENPLCVIGDRYIYLMYLGYEMRRYREGITPQHACASGITRAFLAQCLLRVGADIEKIEREKSQLISRLENRIAGTAGITDDDIQQAKNYPITELIEFNRGFARCLWHAERTPSMRCHENRVHCFGCGRSGDAIDVYMQISGCDFVAAVKFLSGRH